MILSESIVRDMIYEPMRQVLAYVLFYPFDLTSDSYFAIVLSSFQSTSLPTTLNDLSSYPLNPYADVFIRLHTPLTIGNRAIKALFAISDKSVGNFYLFVSTSLKGIKN